MGEVFPYAAVAVVIIAAWAGGIVLLDVFTAPDVRAWRRMSHLRGYAMRASALERVARRAPMLKRMQDELDLERLLAQAHTEETVAGFAARTGAIALMAFAVLLTVIAAARAIEGQWPAPPWVAVVIALLVAPLSLIELRRRAMRTQGTTGRILGDTLMTVAVMTDTRGLQLDDAVRIMSRCARDDALQRLIDRSGFKRLAGGSFRSTEEKYRLIGAAYRIPEFGQVADAAARANVGVPEREVFTRLALAIYQDRLADAKVRAARARILITLPIAGMLVPLLLLIGAPTFHAISSGLGG